jgi:hypothetical protein
MVEKQTNIKIKNGPNALKRCHEISTNETEPMCPLQGLGDKNEHLVLIHNQLVSTDD